MLNFNLLKTPENRRELSYEKCCKLLKTALNTDQEFDKEKCKGFQNWLHWLQSDDPNSSSGSSKAFWIRLYSDPEHYVDRSEHLLKLVKTVNDNGRHNNVQGLLEANSQYSWEYYKHYFFTWFLRRYEITYALRVFGAKHGCFPIALGIFNILLAVLGAVAIKYTDWMTTPTMSVGLPAAALILNLVVTRFCKPEGMPFGLALQTLIPRMAVSVAAGYFGLISATRLHETILLNQNSKLFFIILNLALLTAICGYVSLEIARRVNPTPKPKRIFKLMSYFMTISLGYAAISIFPAASIIIKHMPAQFQLIHFLKGATLALTALGLGVVLQLVWSDMAVTEPLGGYRGT